MFYYADIVLYFWKVIKMNRMKKFSFSLGHGELSRPNQEKPRNMQASVTFAHLCGGAGTLVPV